MTPEHKAKWDVFVQSYPNREALAEEQKMAMFKFAWKNPSRNVDQHHAALTAWQTQRMSDANSQKCQTGIVLSVPRHRQDIG
jgi:hypothetical protein